MVRDYRKGNKLTQKIIENRIGPLMYNVKTDDHGNWRGYIDQIVGTKVEQKYGRTT